MADLLIDDDTVTVSLSGIEKVEALHGDVTVPRSAIVGARAVADGMAEVHGLRMPGTGFPGLIMVGTFRHPRGTTFAVCHGQQPAVVLDLSGANYDRIVATVANPEDAVRSLS
ncbi:MAG: hypothetical protein ACRDPB_08020 [Nocardioidaceae bacterium]